MMAHHLLRRLRAKGVGLRPAGADLRVTAPSGALSSDERDALKTLKPALLALLDEEQRDRGPERRGGEELARVPLTYAQEGIWLMQEAFASSRAYNVHARICWDEPVDIPAYQQAIQQLVACHEVLRSRIEHTEQGPVLCVDSEVDVPAPYHDLTLHTSGSASSALADLVEEHRSVDFDLAAGPLWRVDVAATDAARHHLLITAHHIIIDGWSLVLLMREFSHRYETIRAGGETSSDTAPTIQYPDFACWQRRPAHYAGLGRAERYWSAQLHGIEPLALVTDRLPIQQGPATQHERDADGAEEILVLTSTLRDQVDALAAAEHTTPFVVLVSALAILMQRWSRQDDFPIGSVVAGRQSSHTNEMLGCFVNTIVLRCSLGDAPTFRDLVGRMKGTVLDALEHQAMPYTEIVRGRETARTGFGTGLLRTTFQLQDFLVQVHDAAGRELSIELDRADASVQGAVRTDLSFFLAPGKAGGYRGSIQYRRSLFDGGTIRSLAARFARIVAQATAEPRQCIAELELLTDAERVKLLGPWSTPGMGIAARGLVHDEFMRAATRLPDKAAIDAGGRVVTYAELSRTVDQFARRLVHQGVSVGDRVALVVERKAEVIAAMLAVLRIGAAYVPLDPDYPDERLSFMMGDSEASFLLTFGGVVPDWAGTVSVVDACQGAEAQPQDVPDTNSTALAYVIYTSGSSGKPKGVGVSQDALARYTAAATEVYAIVSSDRVLQFASLSFDASIEEIFPALVTGATVVLRDDDMIADELAFLERIEEQGISVLALPTSYWSRICSRLEPSLVRRLAGVRVVIVGGEELRTGDAQRWLSLVGEDPVLVNTYGPTEGTVVATSFNVDSALAPDQRMPIGRPWPGTSAFILDEELRPVAPGMPGELCLGGPRLAMGYINRPGLTASKFVDARGTIETDGASRIYRTGDLARFRDDGEIEFLGRADDQVKVNGYRVELGEIEALLQGHDFVIDAAASVVDGRLCAYVSAEDAAGNDLESELRELAIRCLPGFMRPASYTFLSSLPSLPNGKLDRVQLPRPNVRTDDRGALRGRAQLLLAGLWSEVLEVGAIGPNDNFFALGGHSLLAVRVCTMLRDVHGVELPLREFFESATLAELADALDRATDGTEPDDPILAAPGEPVLSFGQERIWFLEQLSPKSGIFNMSGAVELHGALDVDALRHAFLEVVMRHDVLRVQVENRAGVPALSILPVDDWDLPVYDLSEATEEEKASEVERLEWAEASRSMLLSDPPLMRTCLVRLAKAHHILVLTLHHFAADGVSLEVLMSEVSSLYRTNTRGLEAELPPVPVQYSDFAAWQRTRMSSPEVEAQIVYWRERLADLPRDLLPLDMPRRPSSAPRARTAAVRMDSALADRIRGVCGAAGTTPFVLMVAAVRILLWRHCGSPDVPVGMPVAGRNRPELEGVIGFFVNFVVLREPVEARDSFVDFCRRAGTEVAEALVNQDVPFDLLVRELGMSGESTTSPVFQVVANLVHDPGPLSVDSDLEATVCGKEGRIAQHDLVFRVVQGASGIFSAAFDYDETLFRPETIRALADRYAVLLDSLLSDPGRAVADAEVLLSEDRRLLDAWSPGPVVCTDTPFIEHFQRRVEQSPRSIALEAGSVSLTYLEANKAANRVARHLARRGVRAGGVVAVCLDRTADWVLAILAIWKLGACYVPLDPTSPPKRMATIIEDCAPTQVVTCAAYQNELPPGVPLVLLDQQYSEISAGADTNLKPASMGVAYVLYTSGSSGTPKGVAITQQSLANLCSSEAEAFGIREGARVLQFASVGFDATVLELAWSLPWGATLCLSGSDGPLIGPALHEYLSVNRVSHAWLPPSVLASLSSDGLDELEVLVTGGERCSASVVSRWAPGRRFVNAYGPTEATVVSTTAVCTVDDEEPPIGRPILNASVHVLDQHLQLVPPGYVGELCIGGAGVALGYLNQSELTRESFVAGPSARSGGALYRTGDLVRFRRDGSLEFVGRRDRQVKVRGFRIELAEVEAALESVPDVAGCAVRVVGEGTPEAHLVGYVVATGLVSDILESLKAQVPRYMIPSRLVRMDALPLTKRGKVDLDALARTDVETQRVPNAEPEGELEKRLCSIFAGVLEIGAVGTNDDFFSLGGHSLQVPILLARVREELGVDLGGGGQLRLLLEDPTVRGLATAIRMGGYTLNV